MLDRASLAALLVSTLLTGPQAEDGKARHETNAERLHRKGVYCMEEIERSKCAIERFEELLDEHTDQRELVTDAMLRLVKLYQQENRSEDIAPVTRRFWDVGMKRRSRGHVPYSTRFFPSTMNVLFMVHIQRIVDAKISQRLGPDARDFFFTCSEVRRKEISERRRWNRAKKKAAEQGREPIEIIYEEQDKARAARERRERERRESKREEHEHYTPVFVEAACPIVEAFGKEDVLAITRGVAAMNHADFRDSMAVVEIPDLDALLAHGMRHGGIVKVGEGRWILPGIDYYGSAIHLATLDRNELVVAPAKHMEGLIDAREKHKRRLDRKIDTLIGGIPRDVGFFFVMTEVAMKELAFGPGDDVKRGLLELLLPRPKGLQVAGVFEEYFGLFTRMPTDTPIKGRMLIDLARLLIASEEEEGDEEEAELLRSLDVAEAEDRRALLLSYVLSPSQIEQIID